MPGFAVGIAKSGQILDVGDLATQFLVSDGVREVWVSGATGGLWPTLAQGRAD
jgi:hypothetical protein